MKYYLSAVSIVFFSFISSASEAAIPIRINSPAVTTTSYPSAAMIKDIALRAMKIQHINLSNNKYYAYTTVSLKNNPAHPYLLISLHSRAFFTNKIIRVNLDKNFNVIDTPLNPSNNQYALAQCPNPNIKFLIAVPFSATDTNDVKSADYAVNQVYPAAVAKYGKDSVIKLISSQDTVQNFKNHLSCPNLEGVFSIASHDEIGQSFLLYDGSFNYQFFYEQPGLNYTKAIISFDTCYPYADTLPGLCHAITEFSPKVYTGGVTPLTLYGSPETYACFWTKILSNNEQPTKSLLDTCAQENDPFAKNSQSPLYIIGPKYEEYETSFNFFTVHTNLSNYKVTQNEQYGRLSLALNESVTKVTLTDQGSTFDCKGAEALFNKPGLKASEFMLSYDGNTCEIMEFKASDIPEYFPEGYAVYGMSPDNQCGQG